jgi:hypothetical protein
MSDDAMPYFARHGRTWPDRPAGRIGEWQANSWMVVPGTIMTDTGSMERA